MTPVVELSCPFNVRLFCFAFVGLKPFQPVRTIEGSCDAGYGVAVVLGEKDVARVKSLDCRKCYQCPKRL